MDAGRKSVRRVVGANSNQFAFFVSLATHSRNAHARTPGRGVATSPISAAAASRGRSRRYESPADRARSVTFGRARASSRAVTVRNVSYSSTLARKSLCVV